MIIVFKSQQYWVQWYAISSFTESKARFSERVVCKWGNCSPKSRKLRKFSRAWPKINQAWEGSLWVRPPQLFSILSSICMQMCENCSTNQMPGTDRQLSQHLEIMTAIFYDGPTAHRSCYLHASTWMYDVWSGLLSFGHRYQEMNYGLLFDSDKIGLQSPIIFKSRPGY